MREDGDLRARIEARVAARRLATGRPSPGVNGRTPPSPSGAGGEASDEPAPPLPSEDSAVAPSGETGTAEAGTVEAGSAETEDLRDRPRPGPGRRRPKPPGSRPSPAAAPRPASAPEPATDTGPGAHDPEAEPNAPRSPDISRFLSASEPQPDDEKREPSAAAKNTRKVVRILLRIALLVGIAVGAALLLRTYVVAPYYIPSQSMEPTLHGCTGCNDDHVLVDKISYRLHDPHQSDIVVFTRPPGAPTDDHVLIKRVIGLPGDRVALEHGHVYINGKRLKEPYVRKACGPHPTQPETGKSRWRVPKGDLFVLGDNRCDSMDSREFGPIAESSVIGRAFAIIWPLHRIGLL